MADPTTPTPTVDPSIAASLADQANNAEAAAIALTDYNDVVLSSVDSLGKFNTQMNISGVNLENVQTDAGAAYNAISALSEKIKGYSVAIQQNNELTKTQSTEMGVVTTALLGTRNAFANLASVDTTRLNTFGGQWKSISETFKNSGGALGGLIKQAESMANSFGRSLPDAAKTSVSALETFMGTMLRSADNTLKAQNALVQYAGKTGNLSALFAAAGPNLSNMNELISQQRIALLDSAQAVNLLPEEVEKYYDKLGSIPGAFTASVTASDGVIARSGGNMSKTVSMLSATILTAIGSGRSYESVMQDLNTAFKNYGLTGESALKFSASMRKISDDNAISIDTVQSALSATANEFGRFAQAGDTASRMSQGLAENMDLYTDALKKAGMTGDAAANTYVKLGKNISDMSIAQKAFLSQQTGGPGGLQGAFQIEKMLKDGDIKGVMDKVRKQMLQMTGEAVSIEEAANSPAAASRLTRQREILKQGPLGSMASNDQDASRILEAFSNMGKGKAPDTDFSKTLGTTMDHGLDLQGQSLTELQKINIATAKMAAAADTSNAGLLERNVGGGVDANGNFSARQQGLRSFTSAGATASGSMNDRTKAALATGQILTDTTGEALLTGTKDVVAFVDQVKNMGKKALSSFQSKAKDMLNKIESEMSGEADTNKLNALKNQKSNILAKLGGLNTAISDQATNTQAISGTSYRPPSLNPNDQALPPGQQLGVVTRGAASQIGRSNPSNAAPSGDPGGNNAAPLTLGAVNVHVTATCEHCGNSLNNKTPQAQAVTVANR